MYGTTAAAMRNAVAELLDMRRPSFCLGGANGARPETTTADERAEAVAKILRYRKVVYDYGIDLLETAIPEGTPGWEAPRRLLYWLRREQPSVAGLPGGRRVSTTELMSVQDTLLTEMWRRAAAAAVAGRERELPMVAEQIRFTEGRVLVRDAADLTWALLTLDARYFPLPGWQRLSTASKWQDSYGTNVPHRVDSSLSAAQLCSEWARSITPAEASVVDRAGYWPPTPFTAKPYPFGFDGAIAAQHNLFVWLGMEFPSADAMIAVLRTQRQACALAVSAATAASSPALADTFAVRAERYKVLLGLMMDRVASLSGGGARSVADAETVQRGLEDAIGTGDIATVDQLGWLQQLFTMTDTRIAGRMWQGIRDDRYLVWESHTLSGDVVGGVRRAVKKFAPINGRNHPNLYAAVKKLGRVDEEWRRSVEPNAARARNDFSRMLVRSEALDTARRYGPKPVEYSGAAPGFGI
jgi:hypothetical protein